MGGAAGEPALRDSRDTSFSAVTGGCGFAIAAGLAEGAANFNEGVAKKKDVPIRERNKLAVKMRGPSPMRFRAPEQEQNRW